jgi:hypothetical protein
MTIEEAARLVRRAMIETCPDDEIASLEETIETMQNEDGGRVLYALVNIVEAEMLKKEAERCPTE